MKFRIYLARMTRRRIAVIIAMISWWYFARISSSPNLVLAYSDLKFSMAVASDSGPEISKESSGIPKALQNSLFLGW